MEQYPMEGQPQNISYPPNPDMQGPTVVSNPYLSNSGTQGTIDPGNPYVSNSYIVNPYAPNPYEQTAPPPPATLPYSKVLLLGLITTMVLSFLFAGIQALAVSLFGGALISMFVIDWKGLLTTDGLLKWRQMSNGKRVGMGCLLYCFFPIFLVIYLVRMGTKVFQTQGPIFSKEWNAPVPVKKRAKIGFIVGGISAVILLIGSVGAAAAPATSQTDLSNATSTSGQTAVVVSTSAPAQTVTPTPTTMPTPTPVPYAHFDDGTFVVGKDIQPGTYRTRQASPNCYYERLKGFGGTLDDIIANDNTDDPAIVTILPSDKGFQSSNCGTWTKDLSAITTSKTSFDDGMYIVGTDMQPGTYKSSGQTGCYYARLSGFGGTLDDIIANNNTDTAAIVTISARDKGFQSKGCGTWTKM